MTEDPKRMPQKEGWEEIDSLRHRINECEKRNQTLIETNLYGIQVIDIHGTITYINGVQSDILGYGAGDLAGEEIWSLMATDEEGEALSQYLTRLAREEDEAPAWTGTFLKKNHLPVQLEMNWNCMRNEQRSVTGFVSFTTAVHGESGAAPENDGDRDPDRDRIGIGTGIGIAFKRSSRGQEISSSPLMPRATSPI